MTGTQESRVRAMDVEIALTERCRKRGDGYWTEIEVQDPNGLLRLDGVALSWSFHRMWISGFEVKVSRSDFLRDAKYTVYRRYVDDLTLVCPARMIDRDEVPDGIGLLWYHADAKPGQPRLRYRRKPEPCDGDTHQIEHQLLRRLTRDSIDTRPNRFGRYETARRYVEERTALKNIGDALGSKMALRLQQLERLQEPTHMRQVQARADAYDRLTGILNRHGYTQVDTTTRPDHMDRALRDLDRALSHTAPLDTVDRETRYLADSITYLRRQLGLDRKEDQQS
ncbi:hypothetical protein [Bifidobacterium rousetti]|uniref:hypothetical protein n=1 Tax=Bifidobacterium rousetti TaxID=2045439 RepID=UPI00123B50B4|nr:hypothetical protein [Bifidobacterium rousetti]